MIKYYTVGGCVRDEILGIKNKDIDYAVEAPSYDAMREDILNKGVTIFQERPQYFAIRGSHPVYGGVDYILCRKDGIYSDSRRPDSVEAGTIYDDLARRDFTVNAIAKTDEGEYIDPHGGKHDLERMFLRCVGDTEARFVEDPLRILRAMRFHIVRGFKLSEEINWFFDYRYILLKTLPLERVYDELYKCFDHDAYATLKFLQKHNWLTSTIFQDMKLRLLPTGKP